MRYLETSTQAWFNEIKIKLDYFFSIIYLVFFLVHFHNCHVSQKQPIIYRHTMRFLYPRHQKGTRNEKAFLTILTNKYHLLFFTKKSLLQRETVPSSKLITILSKSI